MKNVMQFVIDNWAMILTFIFVIIVAVQRIIEFISLPTDKKITEVKARLLIWVTKAENDLGSGTSTLKFAQVYNDFCVAFPYLKKWISLDKFEEYVKEALVEMRKVLAEKAAKEEAKISDIHN